MTAKKWIMAITVLSLSGYVAAGENDTTTVKTSEKITETTTKTVITTTVVTEKVKWQPFRVCVLDFSSVDIEGQKRFLDQNNRPIVIPPQCTLNDADRQSVNGVMQGFVRMIDAWSDKKTADSNRRVQENDNHFTRAQALDIYNRTAAGDVRPAIIGAQYLSAYLGRRNDVFSCLAPSLMTNAMMKLKSEPDFPRDFMLRLARETGATHLIYGTVSDLRTRTNSFQGYGIRTQTTNYQLDIIIKMVDLIRQATVYSNVYTGNYREQKPISTVQIDNNIFQNLMTSALEQAAEDLYDKCKPGRKNAISVTPMPYMITINPSGGTFFKPSSAEIYINGSLAGSGGTPLMIPAGKYRFDIRAPGYKNQSFDLVVSRDAAVNVNLEK